MSKFLLGINYWPRRSAMYMWRRFDLGEIREDMARIKALGMDLVRFFILWESFQPHADVVDLEMLGRFDAVMDAIAGAGLSAMPTLFCGHMSGCNWLPSWSLDPATRHGRFRTISNGHTSPYGIGDFYADTRLLEAQLLLARSVAQRARAHPALYCWDLGNEFSNLREPDSPRDAAEWSRRLTHELEHASNAPSTGGTHGEDLERDRNIRPSTIALPWETATMHGYSVYSTFARGRLDTDVVPFYLRLMQSFSGKPVLFSEFGNPTCPAGTVSPYDRVPLPGEPPIPMSELPRNAAPYACLTEDEMAPYARDVIGKLHRAGATGALWWCWADYAHELAALPPFDRAIHELNFGIVRSDGTYKPVARALNELSQLGLRTGPDRPPIAAEGTYYETLPKGLYALYRDYAATH